MVFAVARYGDELTAVITHTVDRWDGKEAARKIELHVGRDLQFIRINGTIVGGLVGVLIHTVERAAAEPGPARVQPCRAGLRLPAPARRPAAPGRAAARSP